MYRRPRFLFLALLCLALLMPALAAGQDAPDRPDRPDRSDGPDEKSAAGDKPQGPPQGKSQGPPPARVVVAKAKSGMVRPTQEFVATIHFPEVADVAAEVAGRVDAVNFEAGDQAGQGDALVVLDTEITRTELEAAIHEHKQVLSSLESAEKELARMEQLLSKHTVPQQEYDTAFFLVAGLRNKATALDAETKKLQITLEKSVIHAPFDGVVLERLTQRGEWLGIGSAVASLARNDVVDVHVHLPQVLLGYIHKGLDLDVRIGAATHTGTVEAVIPKGDVATRTFPVRIRLPNPGDLAQGMEARLRVPAGEMVEAVLVPRDAVLQAQAQTSVWAALGGKAVNIPVRVTAYPGQDAAVQSVSPELQLAPGMDVVIKGNERLRPGQPVVLVNEAQASEKAAPEPKE
jgi:membrane fusion protein, multidrug efflux system